jgi:hypothetical protein
LQNKWQNLDSSNGTFDLFNAFYDTRNESDPMIRILAFTNPSPTVKLYCSLVFDDFEVPVLIETHNHRALWIGFGGDDVW